jgi:hypothetical protein
MRMRQQYCVEFRKRVNGDTGSADTREKFAERRVEIGVSENPFAPNFD